MLGELHARHVLIVVRGGSHRRRVIHASYPVTQSCPTCGQESSQDEPGRGPGEQRGIIPGRQGEHSEVYVLGIPPMRP